VTLHSSPASLPLIRSILRPGFVRQLIRSTCECKAVCSRAIFPISIFCFILLNTAYAGKKEELENLRKRIEAMQLDMEETRESKVEAVDSLRESERAISNSNRKLAELAAQQHDADQKLKKLQAQQQKLSSSMSEQQSLLNKLLYQQYIGGEQEYLKLLLNNLDPNQIAREFQYYQYIARSRSTWLTTLRQNVTELNSISQATQEQRSELASLHAEQAAQQRILEKEKNSKKHMLVKISRQLHQQHREISRLQRNEVRLSQLIDKLTKLLAQPKSNSLFNNDNLPDSSYDGRPFDQLKGKLILPVKGVVTNRFGATRPDSTVQWKGLFLKSASGQSVKSIAAGQVVFADWLRGFGNLLIIDHGNGYMSLYGNNETLYKQVGDILRGGDTIASVGNSGGNEDFGLYFELRHQSKPLDPMVWVAKKSH
jgi:murein hydrolase activator